MERRICLVRVEHESGRDAERASVKDTKSLDFVHADLWVRYPAARGLLRVSHPVELRMLSELANGTDTRRGRIGRLHEASDEAPVDTLCLAFGCVEIELADMQQYSVLRHQLY
jgi:hypothetical protein